MAVRGERGSGLHRAATRLKGRITALLEDRLLAVVPVDHRLASLPRFPIKEVENEPFISLLETSDHDARRALEAAGVKPNIRYTTKDDYAIIAMVEQGLGVSIMPELLLSGRSDNVRIMELTPPASRTIGLCLPDADRAGPATARFAQCVSDWSGSAIRGYKTRRRELACEIFCNLTPSKFILRLEMCRAIAYT